MNIVGDAANEPSIAVDPTNPNIIVIGWRQFDSVSSNFRQAGWAYSHDQGRSWTSPGVLEPGVFRSDPVLDADADGNIYYMSLTLDFDTFDNFRLQLFKSTDGGITFRPGVNAFGGDKEWMVIDRTDGFGRGNIYSKWQSFFNCCGLETFTRSTDGGATFEKPLPVPRGPTFGTTDIGPEGVVYATGIEAVNRQNFDSIVIAVSHNAQFPGATPLFDFSVPVDLGGRMIFEAGPNPEGLLGQIVVATDHSDRFSRGFVYLLASLATGSGDPMDVVFARSTTGGFSFSAPVRVNDDPIDGRGWRWLATMSVAPTGRIDALWFDTRNDARTEFSELYYAFSTDTGRTWSKNIPVTPPFNHSLGYPNNRKLGDYFHTRSDAAGVNVAYAATFNREQDVYFLRLDLDCDGNGVHDWDDLAFGRASDCNSDGIPDACQKDRDQDGLTDDCDACPSSQTIETIVMGPCDTGVTNILFNEGCSMADELAKCRTGPSREELARSVTCAVAVARRWQQESRITGRDFDQITFCAAEAAIHRAQLQREVKEHHRP